MERGPTLHDESPDEACGAAFVGGPVASIEPYRRGAAYGAPGEFVIACGRL